MFQSIAEKAEIEEESRTFLKDLAACNGADAILRVIFNGVHGGADRYGLHFLRGVRSQKLFEGLQEGRAAIIGMRRRLSFKP